MNCTITYNNLPSQYVNTIKTEINNYFYKELEITPFNINIRFECYPPKMFKIIIDVKYNLILNTVIQYIVDMNDPENLHWIYMLGKNENKIRNNETEDFSDDEDSDETLIEEEEDNEFDYVLENNHSHTIIYDEEKLPTLHEEIQEANIEIVKELNLYLIRKHLLLRNEVMMNTFFYCK